MHVVITGGRLHRQEARKRAPGARRARDRIGPAGDREADAVRHDACEGIPDDARVTAIAGDITDLAAVHQAIRDDVGGVFHLAAIVSANAEEDFDLGMRVNLEGTRNVLEACRALPQPARLVFASSVAVYGGDMPEVLDDGTILTPQTSYGAQKAIGELLLNDYSRKGFVDGRALRLPTIVVRPGRPNRAASTFASSIIREPLAGQEAICPVGRDAAMYILSPRRVVEALVRVRAAARGVRHDPDADPARHHGVDRRDGRRAAGGRGRAGRARVRWQPDPTIQRIGWPTAFDARRARAMGFAADSDFASIIRAHVEDELGGRIA